MRRRIRRGPLRWLLPGMHIKRWLLVLVAGITLFSLGCAYLLRVLYDVRSLPSVFYYLTLQFIPRWGRALLLGATLHVAQSLAASLRGILHRNDLGSERDDLQATELLKVLQDQCLLGPVSHQRDLAQRNYGHAVSPSSREAQSRSCRALRTQLLYRRSLWPSLRRNCRILRL